MPHKKDKHQQVLTTVKPSTTPLANSTNIVTSTPITNRQSNQTVSVSNSYHDHNGSPNTTMATKTSLINDSLNYSSLVRDHKHELGELNTRFSNYVIALRKKSKENEDLQKKVDVEKQKYQTLAIRDNSDLEKQMTDLRIEIDESAVLTEHFLLKRLRAQQEVIALKTKLHTEEQNTFECRRQGLENDYKQSLNQLNDLNRRYQEIENVRQTNKIEMEQMNKMHKNLEDQFHDISLGNVRLQCNIRTLEEQLLLLKAIQETEKAEFANEQIKQQQFYTDELSKAVDDIKRDFQVLLKHNKETLERTYTERIDQVKTQILAQESNQQPTTPSTRASISSLQDELKQVEQARKEIDDDFRPLMNLYLSKQQEKNQFDDERQRLDSEYNRLTSEVNQLTEAIEIGKQHWFSVHFELETYRRLLDLETNGQITSGFGPMTNGKDENNHQNTVEQQRQATSGKKPDAQRSISKTGKFDIDQVQVGFISINNASMNCVDQSLNGWTLVRVINNEREDVYHFPDSLVLKAKTRVRVYSNKTETGNLGGTSGTPGRLIASTIPAWASTGPSDNIKIMLLDDKGTNRAQYSEIWQ